VSEVSGKLVGVQWLARGEGEVPSDDTWLAPAEVARQARYRFTKRRTEYRLRRWAGKQTVAALVGLDPAPYRLAAIEVLNRPSGAPYVLVDGVPLDVDVSLTDRAGWAVCLVGERAASGVGEGLAGVGVDLEVVEPRSDAFVSDFLTTVERDHVRGLAGRQEQDAAANLIWSAKESALKVLRVGLRADTRSVEVHLTGPARPDGWAPLEVLAGAGRWLPGWWRRDGAFLLTVVHGTPSAPPAVLPAQTASGPWAANSPLSRTR
jgi:4'-phosphopantetheinyl transferase